MHIVNRLYTAEFDFAPFEGSARKSVMVATVPRSGSTVFSEFMWRTGRLGCPMEFANIANRSGLFNRLGSVDWSDYWGRVKGVRTSPNGVFSYKMFSNNYIDICRNHPSLYQQIVSTHVVYLTREDILGQAISYSKACQTNAWFAGVKEAVKPEYDAEHITKCIKWILMQKAFWENAFTLADASVLRVSYEDFLRDKLGVIKSVAAFLGEDLPGDNWVDIPLIGVQRDGKSEEWRKRFLQDRDLDTIRIFSPTVSRDFEFVTRSSPNSAAAA